jgi:NAD(P)-dependent dehydrogenase (short-subunit alcohol dehydrogenase family)
MYRNGGVYLYMTMRLKDKVAVVTGGASGIGAAAAVALTREGAQVHILDIQAPEPCDVSNSGQVSAAFARFGPVDVLVNAAGVAIRYAVHEQTEEDWDRSMAVNVKGIFLCSKYALNEMPAGGSIIHLSSVTGITGVRDRAAYSATKGAIISLTRNMAVDYAERGIRVNCICPGFVRTPLIGAILRDPERTARLTALHPLGRLGEVEDIANAVIFLASQESAWITGHSLVVDGGFSAGHPSPI